MEVKSAIQYLKNSKSAVTSEDPDNLIHDMVMDMAIKALEKQIPMKLTKLRDKIRDAVQEFEYDEDLALIRLTFDEDEILFMHNALGRLGD